MPTRVIAAFRVVGKMVEPESITQRLELQPSSQRTAGAPVSNRPGRSYPSGSWILESPLPESAPLDDHLRELCSLLSSRAEALKAIREEGCETELMCGVFIDDEFGGSVYLPPTLYRALDELGIGLRIDLHDVA